MWKNPFAELEKREWVLWIVSVILVGLANILAGKIEPVTIFGTFTGVTALVFLARGNVWGQILTIVFSILYAIVSFEQRYYGEMITYLAMTMPMAILSVFSWLKNPFENGKSEVKIHTLTTKEKIMMPISAIVTTAVFYFILKYFNTANLFFSTVSVTTSFAASYLTFYRSCYYALAYAANDVILIILWVLASIADIVYLPMVVCFGVFLVNDIYGFKTWKNRKELQTKSV